LVSVTVVEVAPDPLPPVLFKSAPMNPAGPTVTDAPWYDAEADTLEVILIEQFKNVTYGLYVATFKMTAFVPVLELLI
jgi:hypothetical protein